MAHNQIKTYSFVDSVTDNSMFLLKRMEDIYFNGNGESDSPHRHDYYAIILVEKGSGVHYVDFQKYDIEDCSVYFILPGQMHQVVLNQMPKGWVLAFTSEFLISNSISDKLINDIYLFNHYGQSPPLPLSSSQMVIYQGLISQMEHFSISLKNYSSEALGALLKLFLIQSNNHCNLVKHNNPQFIETTNHLLRSFRQLLDLHYKSKHKVSDYADMLAVTADYLNKIVKSITGKPAKEHIQSKILVEAKRTLLFSNISSKELSYELGFDESAHFNNFFKKSTGFTPTEFRSSIRLS
ncbi:MAG: helix-turn-helix domain-containing protein [Paludibacteraceae bacterium]|nr:helix-turn-helix domain-containing protein [Paludibacteraceae bacterium]